MDARPLRRSEVPGSKCPAGPGRSYGEESATNSTPRAERCPRETTLAVRRSREPRSWPTATSLPRRARRRTARSRKFRRRWARICATSTEASPNPTSTRTPRRRPRPPNAPPRRASSGRCTTPCSRAKPRGSSALIDTRRTPAWTCSGSGARCADTSTPGGSGASGRGRAKRRGFGAGLLHQLHPARELLRPGDAARSCPGRVAGVSRTGGDQIRPRFESQIRRRGAQEVPMLMTIGIVLLVLWALGLFCVSCLERSHSRAHRAGRDRHRDAPGEGENA